MANTNRSFEDETARLYRGWAGEYCHPNSPCGSGGPGFFTQADVLGANLTHTSGLAHPNSPVGKNLTQDQIKSEASKLINNNQSPPIRAGNDSVERLREIRRLVQDNNSSTLDENVIICQIFMESRFKADVGSGHDAKGLMQVQLNAVKQVYKYRKQKALGHMPSDKVTTQAFKEADEFHKTPQSWKRLLI